MWDSERIKLNKSLGWREGGGYIEKGFAE